MAWDELKQDFRERFMNFETAKGIYLVPAGLIGLYVTWYHVQYVIQVAGSLLFWYMVSEGIRKIWVNRVKLEVDKASLVVKRLDPHAETVTEALETANVELAQK